MTKSCLNCFHCYDNEICTLRDDLILGYCWMWKQREKIELTDTDCLIIQSNAIGHLLRCAFDDFSIGVLDMANEFKNVFMEGLMNE